eukprot:TRINITY_DN110212_c0_g1_i1.p1 TRINITY_DN110212_c0_g1~~TRINITY_DN110212_c0_g1_i1.p1  ORF type:complete len:300 (-),score=65.13 TRINITY_DN110212_c0_g1_i1:38-937(-)
MMVCDVCLRVWFNFWLVIMLVPAWLISVVGLCFRRCGLCSCKCLPGVVIVLSNIAFRVTFYLVCCCIPIDLEGIHDFRQALKSRDGPVVVVANHTSFLDVMLALKMTPLSVAGKTKMFVSNHLLKLPFLGSIVQAMDHLTVPFKASGKDGGFEVDKELMIEKMAILKAHVQDGGIAAWFPEGKINAGNPCELQQFRAGGFSIPEEVDCEIWCIAFVGNSKCWPRNAAVGGSPSRIGVKLNCLCTSSARFLDDAGLANADSRERQVHLASCAQKMVQRGVLELSEDSEDESYSESDELDP